MKKILTLVLVLLFALSALCSCGRKKDDSSKDTVVVNTNEDGSAEQIINGIKIGTIYDYSGIVQGANSRYAIELENTLDHTVDVSAQVTFITNLTKNETGEPVKASIDHLAPSEQYVITVEGPDMNTKPSDIQIDVADSDVTGVGTSDLDAQIDYSKGLTVTNNSDKPVRNIRYCILFSGDSGKINSVNSGEITGPIKPGESATQDILINQNNKTFVEYLNGETVED